MRWGAALCLVALGCGAAAAPRAVRPRAEERSQRAMRGSSWVPQLPCDRQGCLDWMPEPPDGCAMYGYVLDRAERRPLVDALVVATEVASGRKAQATTNALGQFFFGALAPGRYDVTVVRGAARDRWPGVVLDAGRRTALRFHVARAEK